MLESLRQETEGKLQMLLSPRKNGLTSLNEEVTGFSRSFWINCSEISEQYFFFIFSGSYLVNLFLAN